MHLRHARVQCLIKGPKVEALLAHAKHDDNAWRQDADCPAADMCAGKLAN